MFMCLHTLHGSPELQNYLQYFHSLITDHITFKSYFGWVNNEDLNDFFSNQNFLPPCVSLTFPWVQCLPNSFKCLLYLSGYQDWENITINNKLAMSPFYVCLNVTFFAQAKRYCQTRVPGLTDWMVRNLRKKLISHRESQKRDQSWLYNPNTTHHHPPQ